MVEYSHIPELTQHISEAAFGLYAIAMAYTASQRGSLIYRDNSECQMDCAAAQFCGHGNGRNNVHHVRPQRWMKDHGMPDEEIDSARNGITVCEEFHTKEIHGFQNSEVQRRVRMGLPYWDTRHDLYLAQKAEENTRLAEERGWRFPGPNKTKRKWKKRT